MDLKITEYKHYSRPGVMDDLRNQVSACGRLAYFEDEEAIPIDWTYTVEDTTCPLCIAAIERRDRRIDNG